MAKLKQPAETPAAQPPAISENQPPAEKSKGGAPKGNKNAARPFYHSVRRALARYGDGDMRKGLDLVTSKLVGAALKNTKHAVRSQLAIRDTLDGKLAEQEAAPVGEGQVFVGMQVVVAPGATVNVQVNEKGAKDA